MAASMDTITVQPMTSEESVIAQEWMTQENWPATLDVLRQTETHPGFTRLAARTQEGQLLGVLIYHHVTPSFVYAGFYIVHPEHRGHGIGSLLWSHMLSSIGPTCNIGLDAAPNMVQKYRERSGFVIQSPIASHRYTGSFHQIHAALCALATDRERSGITHVIRKATADDISLVDGYHKKVYHLPMFPYWHAFFNADSGVMCLTLQEGKLLGLCAIRHTSDGGGRIGPLLADNINVATDLLLFSLEQYKLVRPCDSDNLQMLVGIPTICNGFLKELILNTGFDIKITIPRLYTKRLEGEHTWLNDHVFAT